MALEEVICLTNVVAGAPERKLEVAKKASPLSSMRGSKVKEGVVTLEVTVPLLAEVNHW
jgi:hypothetical protein